MSCLNNWQLKRLSDRLKISEWAVQLGEQGRLVGYQIVDDVLTPILNAPSSHDIDREVTISSSEKGAIFFTEFIKVGKPIVWDDLEEIRRAIEREAPGAIIQREVAA